MRSRRKCGALPWLLALGVVTTTTFATAAEVRRIQANDLPSLCRTLALARTGSSFRSAPPANATPPRGRLFKSTVEGWGWTRSDGVHRAIIIDTTLPLALGPEGFLATRDTEKLHFFASVDDIAAAAVPQRIPLSLTFRLAKGTRCLRLVDGRLVLPVEIASYAVARLASPRNAYAKANRERKAQPSRPLDFSWRAAAATPIARVVVVPPSESEIGAEKRSAFSGALQPYTQALRRCYEATLKERGPVQGALVVRFAVDGSGLVTEQIVTVDLLASPPLSTCALEMLRRPRFARDAFRGHMTIYFKLDR
ncbi:MAG: hypothetical protein HYY84_12640 [Deltaproteobacteria bacterium]|nr:hypothetical protein [Deltaproteobacteria bacterium]